MIIAITSVLLGVGMLVPVVWSKLSASSPSHAGQGRDGLPEPTPAPPPPPPPPTLKAGPTIATPTTAKYFAWALMDRKTGEINGSANSATGTNSTESMIKAWIVSDFLRLKGTKVPTAAELKLTSTAIRDSNDNSAASLWSKVGKTKSIARLNSICGMNAKNYTKAPYAGWWSFTQITAQDVTRMGDCIISGKAAGEKWTEYVLTEMRNVRGLVTANTSSGKTGGGHWGIIDGLPENLIAGTSIKNGWTMLNYDASWHINCLAIHEDWVLSVQMRLPNKNFKSWLKGLQAGAAICKSVTMQLVYPQPEPSPSPSVSPSVQPSQQP
ncbi:hypothetical protein F4553_004125 [Allocatelliglobosispora scoriae]|uniref:Uncharacterized protein n=1 Tax=Allocatelliglobosispora scoriae TaxID=643052 RepID=A0A841BTK0_9ACTN|nr:hypothetical protein [Allocatelliglobosispora scoriae]MBB5870746.1 hypothetical protein [Allocatelliglobosispora scoriae]